MTLLEAAVTVVSYVLIFVSGFAIGIHAAIVHGLPTGGRG